MPSNGAKRIARVASGGIGRMFMGGVKNFLKKINGFYVFVSNSIIALAAVINIKSTEKTTKKKRKLSRVA
jgi:hypothetical protein